MQPKIIKYTLRKKINAWVNSIDDDNVKKAVQENAIITGGSIVSLLCKEEVNDFDVYFKTRDAALLVSKYYVDKFNKESNGKTAQLVDVFNHPITNISAFTGDRFKIYIQSAGVAESEVPEELVVEDGLSNDEATEASKKATEQSPNKYRPVFLTSNAITLSDKIQLIVRFFGDVSTLHENYDFVHCTNSWQSWNNELTLVPAALEAIINRRLVYVGSKYPICSIFRAKKFVERGWYINAGQLFKMALQISKLNLSDPHVLEDQLVGVDTAYFRQVIAAVEEHCKTHQTDRIEQSYLVEIIDKIF